MTENEKYMLPEVYYTVLNSLKINYLKYAKKEKIDIYDRTTEFGQKYHTLIEAKNSVMCCDIEKERKYYQDVIDNTKKYLISIGGSYIE